MIRLSAARRAISNAASFVHCFHHFRRCGYDVRFALRRAAHVACNGFEHGGR